MLLKIISDIQFDCVAYTDEIQFDCSIRIIRGDNFRPQLVNLSNEETTLFRIKADHYRRLVIIPVPIFCLKDFYITNNSGIISNLYN